MTKNRDLKQLIRERMAKTGESYTTARRHLERPTPPLTNEIKGWRRVAEKGMPEDYEIGVDPTHGYRGASSALLRSRSEAAAESRTKLMQHFLAQQYLGCRLRFSAWIRTEDLTGSCRLWMEIDENTKLLVAATSHPVTGTAEWSRREVVLDVAPEATLILIGIVIDGAGAAWVGDIEIARVEADVPATAGGAIPVAPRNLSFLE